MGAAIVCNLLLLAIFKGICSTKAATLYFEQEMYTVNEANGTAQPVLVLSNQLPSYITVNICNINGTATGGDVDYASGPYTVQFNAGDTMMIFNVSVIDDNLIENNEKFSLNIDPSSLPNEVTIGNLGQTTVTIVDNDNNTATLYFDQRTYTINEANEAVQPVLRLSDPLLQDITVQVYSNKGSATGTLNASSLDYDSGPFMAQFNAGDTRIMFNVSIIDDNLIESNEKFILHINSSSLPNGVTIGNPNQTTVTILDNDNISSAAILFEHESYNVIEANKTITLILILSKPFPNNINVEVYGSTIGKEDFTSDTNGFIVDDSSFIFKNISFTANDTTVTLNISVSDDNLVETDENFVLRIDIFALTGDFSELGETTFTIIDNDDATLQFEQKTYTVNKSDEVVTPVLILSNPLSTSVTIEVFSIKSLAYGGDVDNTSGRYTVQFNAGDTRVMFNVSVNGDNLMEGIKIFSLYVNPCSLPDKITAGGSGQTIVIIGGRPPQIDEGSITKPPPIIPQKNQRFKIGSQAYIFGDYNVTFDCNVVNEPLPTTILWLRNNVEISSSQGNSSITITDAKDGDNISCNASNSIGSKVATSIIIHVVGSVYVDFDQSSYSINENSGFVKLTLVLSRPMSCNCYVALTVRATDDTAKRGEDYGPETDARIIFPNGITSSTFRIPIINDDDYENSEKFNVTVDPLSLPYGIAIDSSSRAEVTIMDNDRATVRFKEAGCSVYESIGSVKHTLVLNKPLSVDVIIVVYTVHRTTSKNDYEAGPFSISIPAGKEEESFNISIKDNDVYESDESFELVINRARLPPRISRAHKYTSTVTILNNEKLINVSFNESAYVYEHRGPIKPMLILDKPSPCCLKVPVEVMSGTATGYDYDLGRNVSNVTLDITFPAGTTCAPFDIPIIDDIHSEANETFTVSIMNSSLPFGVQLKGPDNAVLTIVDNDFYVSFDKENYIIYEDEGLLEVVVEIESGKKAPTDIFIEVEDMKNTAENGTDYESGPFNVTIKKGEKSAILLVKIFNDLVYESGNDDNGEDFTLSIIADTLTPVGGIHLGRTTKTKVTIVDDEYTLSFGEATYVFKEDVIEAKLNLSVSRPFRKETEVPFEYTDFTATGNQSTNDPENIDYYASYLSPYGVIFPAGITTINLTLNIVNDSRLEDNERFYIVANPPDIPNGHFRAQAEIIIIDDDDFRITFEMDHYVIDKNHLDPTVNLLLKYPKVYNASAMFPIYVNVILINGTSSAENDYYAFENNHFLFNVNQNRKNLFFGAIDDNIVEPNETFFFKIKADTIESAGRSGAQSRVIVGEYGRAMITIVNDDVSRLRITEDNALYFGRPISENVTLNITYDGNKQQKIGITAEETQGKYPLGISKTRINNIEVIVPNYFNRDSIVASRDFQEIITVNFS